MTNNHEAQGDRWRAASFTAAVAAIAELVARCNWTLVDDTLRCIVLKDTDEHLQLELCPLAMAVAAKGRDNIDKVTANRNGPGLAEAIAGGRATTREHLLAHKPDIDAEQLEDYAVRYSAASIIHEDPYEPETSLLLDLDRQTVHSIADAADDPGSPEGRVLARALASSENTLATIYESVHGSLGAPSGDTAVTPAPNEAASGR